MSDTFCKCRCEGCVNDISDEACNVKVYMKLWCSSWREQVALVWDMKIVRVVDEFTWFEEFQWYVRNISLCTPVQVTTWLLVTLLICSVKIRCFRRRPLIRSYISWQVLARATLDNMENRISCGWATRITSMGSWLRKLTRVIGITKVPNCIGLLCALPDRGAFSYGVYVPYVMYPITGSEMKTQI